MNTKKSLKKYLSQVFGKTTIFGEGARKKIAKNRGFTPTPILNMVKQFFHSRFLFIKQTLDNNRQGGIGVSRTLLKKEFRRGFTLIELLVTMVIFVLLTTVVLFSQGGFNDSIILNNLAYDISLTIRQSQQYGSGVKESLSAVQFPSYGVYFSKTQLGQNSFIVFGNPALTWEFFGHDPSGQYSGSINCPFGDPQCIQKYNLRNGARISDFCSGSSDTDCTPASELYLIFTRPKPNANIYSDSGNVTDKTQNYAKITISSASGAKAYVVITRYGQIYVTR
jgi:prepilin-type N-terminal cleavage/methylation domain-containing protein